MAQALRDYVEVESIGAPEVGVDSFSIAPPTESAAFKRWFGDSKGGRHVNGPIAAKPLVVYHGTKNDADFGAFNTPAHFGTAEQANTIAESFFRFGAPAHDALGDSPRVMPVYLSIKDPIYIGTRGAAWPRRVPRGSLRTRRHQLWRARSHPVRREQRPARRCGDPAPADGDA